MSQRFLLTIVFIYMDILKIKIFQFQSQNNLDSLILARKRKLDSLNKRIQQVDDRIKSLAGRLNKFDNTLHSREKLEYFTALKAYFVKKME